MKFQKFAWYLGLLLAARTCLAQTDPSIKVFDVLGATATYPVSINNSGDITGSFCTKVYPCEETDRSGFVRDRDGSITTFDGIPSGINDSLDTSLTTNISFCGINTVTPRCSFCPKPSHTLQAGQSRLITRKRSQATSFLNLGQMRFWDLF